MPLICRPADEDVHVNTCESHIEASRGINSHSVSEPSSFDGNYCGNQGKKRLNRTGAPIRGLVDYVAVNVFRYSNR